MTLQTCVGDRLRLAGVVMQVDWQAVLQGSQMMQQPKEFQRIAEESVTKKMDSIRQEAASRGWLSNDLPSGNLAGHPSCVRLRQACQASGEGSSICCHNDAYALSSPFISKVRAKSVQSKVMQVSSTG